MGAQNKLQFHGQSFKRIVVKGKKFTWLELGFLSDPRPSGACALASTCAGGGCPVD